MSGGSPRTMSAAETAALDRVRRRVGAIAFFSVAIHGVLGLVVVAEVVRGQGRPDAAAGLLAMSGVVATITYVGIRMILAARLWSPGWIALTALPTVAGAFWIL